MPGLHAAAQKRNGYESVVAPGGAVDGGQPDAFLFVKMPVGLLHDIYVARTLGMVVTPDLLNDRCLGQIAGTYRQVVTLEDGCLSGGFGSAVLEALSDLNYGGRVYRLGVGDRFPSHGTMEELQEKEGLGETSLLQFLNRILHED